MTKTIEFIEKEIKNIKELFELDDVLCLKTDEDYKFWYNRLQILKQIKCELEAWEICKKKSVDIEKLKLSTCLEEYNSCRYKDICLTDEEYEVLKNREDL